MSERIISLASRTSFKEGEDVQEYAIPNQISEIMTMDSNKLFVLFIFYFPIGLLTPVPAATPGEPKPTSTA